ncbi:MAG TPA: hypothetical protein VFS21_05590 [Roseiflexaceae bacterium]|nr:hypothetical protein [Roseiflexaceae bacterium]
MSADVMQTATLLAADLAGARVDPNEAQKALAYLRTTSDTRDLLDYLRAVVRDGRAVIRSNQTLGYYRELLAACERHLRGMGPADAAQTLGWAVRLLRYYRAVPEALRADHHAPAVATEPPALVRPAAPQLPAVGEVFTGPVTAVDEEAVVVEVPGFSAEKAIGVLKAELLGGRRFRTGNAARVEVLAIRTRKNGLQILELKPAPKKQ